MNGKFALFVLFVVWLNLLKNKGLDTWVFKEKGDKDNGRSGVLSPSRKIIMMVMMMMMMKSAGKGVLFLKDSVRTWSQGGAFPEPR